MSSTAPLTANQRANIHNGIPPYIQYTSPVSVAPRNENGSGASLPLNIVALIVAYLDEPADLANVTRTCRLLYYMTLPSLYKKVDLRSHPEIRYVNGRPEGFGSGSPFLMALNGFISGSHAGMVKELRLVGEWREPAVEEFALGRVPDTSIMLNSLVRAAMSRMSQLETFSWQLDLKPHKVLYQGLQISNTLTSLTLKFPSTRDPRPSVMIPPITNLRKFKASDIDPLCYPDDISMLLFGSKKLEDLRLHFSPRMRREAECSLFLETYFGRCLRGEWQIPLKHMAMQNYYGPNTKGLDKVARVDTLKSITTFDMFGGPGGSHGGTRNIYLDATWHYIPMELETYLHSIRCNEKSPQQVQLLSKMGTKLSSFFLVNAKCPQINDQPNGSSALTPPGSGPPTPETVALGKQYLNVLTRTHGHSLKKLLLSDEWLLSQDEIADLVRHCPNLEQLGLAAASKQVGVVRMLIPFLPKLKALRLLANDSMNEHLKDIPPEQRMDAMSRDLWASGVKSLQWVGIGDEIYRTGNPYSVSLDDGTLEWRREMIPASLEDVKDVEIWRLDSLDIDLDHVMPFDP